MFSLILLILLAFVKESCLEVFHYDNALPNLSVCGINPTTDKIYGGRQTSFDEYPWLAALEYEDKNDGIRKIKCAGTLITKRHIVTAAHCIKTPHKMLRAWLGDWQISTDPDCQNTDGFVLCNEKVQKVETSHAVYHPKFDDESIKNDIGVIFLERDAIFNTYVKPICLPSHSLLNPPRGTTLFATGWGVTEKGSTSDIKLKVELPLKNNNECNRALFENLIYAQLCVGGEDKKDTCSGDSGGPLMNYYLNDTTGEQNWYLIGVVSYGYECGVEGFPAIYTRVASYVHWIVKTITIA